MKKKNKIALITGATSGIGMGCAIEFAKNSYDLIITGRRQNILENFSKKIAFQYKINVLPLCFDIQDKESVEKSLGSLPPNWRKINVLINNAGLALGMEPIQNGHIEDWEKMIDTNIKGILYVSSLVMPLMIAHGEGHIFNVGSIAGKETYASGNVYCASKAAVDALTKAMRIDLLPHHIKVTHIAPGAAQTEFSDVRFKGDKNRAEKVYDGFKPLTGENVAKIIFFIAALPEHVNINDIVIMPTAQASPHYLLKK